MKRPWLPLALLLTATLPLLAQNNLPRYAAWQPNGPETLACALPAQLQSAPTAQPQLRFLVLQLAPDWAPDWKQAAFQLKGLIVGIKSQSPQALVGIEGARAQIEALLGQELAAYFDGYVYADEPWLPEADPTGKLWQKTAVAGNQVLSTLIEAASLGVELVLFEQFDLSLKQRELLDVVAKTRTGSLDEQPAVSGLDQSNATFFFDPVSGDYHLALFAAKGEVQTLTFQLGKGTKTELLFPKGARHRHQQYASITELRLDGDSDAYFFRLEPGEKAGTSESLEVTTKKIVDPYELVVKNQVFKEEQERLFQSLEVDEQQNYRYAVAGGIDFDVTFEDRVIQRKGQPIERIRQATYLGGVKWKGDKQPELPLISPEKVQTAPLVIDLDKSYTYTYKGEDTVDGQPTWKVGFEPKESGNFYSGTVWIDQQNGSHRKLRAIQSGLEPPVIGNETTVFFDWVEQDGVKYWTQIREENLQLINIVGERIVLQIGSSRANHQFNSGQADQNLKAAYAGKATILRDTQEGFRYLKAKGDGEREISEDTFLKKKAVLGGILFDPALDSPIPLAGFNYTNLDFLGQGYQANFFLAGAINDMIVSNPNFLGTNLDFTAELFLTPLYFGDTVYEENEERKDLEIESLTESFNLTLGVPLGSFWKFSGNYGLIYRDYKRADDTNPAYILPKSHLEHVGRVNLEYSRSRFVSRVQYAFSKRSAWEDFGLPQDTDTVEDSFSTLEIDMTLSKRLPKFQNITGELRYLKGWNLDRFSRFGFGFFENRVSGFGTSGIRGDSATRVKFEYEKGIKGLFNIEFDITGARAELDETVIIGGYQQPESVDLAGIGAALNFMGPWQTLIRFDVGYGAYSSLKAEEGDVSGQIVFLKLF